MSLRIFAVADIHGSSRNLNHIRRAINRFHPRLLVLAGDITQYAGAGPVIRFLDRLEIPMLCIRGNSDLPHIENLIRKSGHLFLLGSAPVTLGGIPFLGLNGTLPLPFASRICLWEGRALETIAPVTTGNTVVVAHPPPRYVLDRAGKKFHAGSFLLNRFIRTFEPRLLLCGHIHEQAGISRLNRTLVVNCAATPHRFGTLIDIHETGPVQVKNVTRCLELEP